jgi:hypothetical protein
MHCRLWNRNDLREEGELWQITIGDIIVKLSSRDYILAAGDVVSDGRVDKRIMLPHVNAIAKRSAGITCSTWAWSVIFGILSPGQALWL